MNARMLRSPTRQPAQARTADEERAEDDRPEDERCAQVRLDEDEGEQRQGDDACPDDRAQARERALARGEVVGEHHRQEDLRHLRELELEPEDRDPARHAAGAAPDHERDDEQADREQVDRPRERAQPVVVGGRRQREHDHGERQPDEAAHEERARLQRVAGAVRERHEQADDGQRQRVERELKVEAVPAALSLAGAERPDARGLEA